MTQSPLTAPALLLALGLSACATTTGTLPYPPVPAPQAETIPTPPVSDQTLVWRPGDWEWNGSGYSWQPGAYVPSNGRAESWVPGHWQAGSSTYVNGVYGAGNYSWVPGHWM